MGTILLLVIFVIVTFALLRWVGKSCRVHCKTWHTELSPIRSILLVVSAALHLVGIAAWFVMALVTLSAIVSQFSPGGPAPHFLVPWFSGLFVLGIANYFAESLNALGRGEYGGLLHLSEDNKSNED